MGNLNFILNLLCKYIYVEKHNLGVIFQYTNIWLLALIVAISIYIYLFILLKKDKKYCEEIASLAYEVAVFKYIDYRYYTKNIYITLFKLFIFFFCTVFFYVIIRMRFLGETTSLSQTNLYNYLIIQNYMIFILFLIFIAILRLYLDKILYSEVLRTHLYFCNYYNKYLIEWKFCKARPGFVINSIFSEISYRLYYIYDADVRNHIDCSDILGEAHIKYTKKLYKIIMNKKILLYIFNKVSQIFFWLDKHIKEIVQETGWLLILLALIWDITQTYLYYTYYALFLYTLRIFYRKFYEFYHGIDWIKDNYLHRYMYELPYFPNVVESVNRVEEFSQKELTEDQRIEQDGIFMSAIAQRDILECPEMDKYLSSDLKLWEFPYYYDDNNPYYIRKIIMIILTVIGYMYIYYKTNIQIILPNVSVIIPIEYLLFISIIVQVYFWYSYNKSKIFKIIFWSLSYIQCILIFIIFLNHNIPLMSTEILIDFGIKFIDNYSVSEKVVYLQEYVKYVLSTANVALNKQEYLLEILSRIPYNQLITDEITFVDIRKYVTSLIEHFIVLESYYYIQEPSVIVIQSNNFIQFIKNIIVICFVTPKLINLIQILTTTSELLYKFPEVCYKIIKSFR